MRTGDRRCPRQHDFNVQRQNCHQECGGFGAHRSNDHVERSHCRTQREPDLRIEEISGRDLNPIRTIHLMPNIDIPLPPDLEELFKLPACADVSLPPPKPLKVQLPGGGTLSAFSDLSKGIPTDCAMTFSLLLQIGPFLGATECLVKVLKLVQTVVDVLKSATFPTDLISAIPKIVKAAEPVIECAVSFTPAGLIPFIRDLLCLILKVLKCLLEQMKSVLKILEETTPQIAIAEQSGNTESLQSLQCAQNNALTQTQHLTASLEALGILL